MSFTSLMPHAANWLAAAAAGSSNWATKSKCRSPKWTRSKSRWITGWPIKRKPRVTGQERTEADCEREAVQKDNARRKANWKMKPSLSPWRWRRSNKLALARVLDPTFHKLSSRRREEADGARVAEDPP